jgi:hypothetical protein
VEKKLLTLPEHLSSPPDFSGVRATRSLDLCVCFVDLFLADVTFIFTKRVASRSRNLFLNVVPLF